MREVRDFAAAARANPEKCNRSTTLKAAWVGGQRARVYSDSGREMFVGGDDEFGAMSVALASFLACEVDLVATHAALRGIELEKLSLEGTGDYNNARYVGIDAGRSPGFKEIRYTARIKAKNATEEQLRDLLGVCETASPVGDTLSRRVSLKLEPIIE